MSQQPFSAAALRGAVDLSSLARPAGPGPAAPGASRSAAGAAAPAAGGAMPGSPASGAGPAPAGVTEVTAATFGQVMSQSMTVPALLVLWAPALPGAAAAIADMASVVQSYGGRITLATADVQAEPQIAQAFQLTELPEMMTLALLGGQPVPLFPGPLPEAHLREAIDKVLEAALANGITGRAPAAAPGGAADGPQGAPPAAELPPLHQKAFDAIEAGDLAGAEAAYAQALKESPADEDARLGLAQVGLLRRTEGADLHAARAAAAAAPQDVDAQLLAADLDLLGGHVEDAFLRLIDTVRATTGDDRERVREHLLELFSVVGHQDERVRKARGSLMSALF